MKKVSVDEFLRFQTRFDSLWYPHQRFGQAFVNTYVINSGPESAELFYTECRKEAENIIWNNFIWY